MPITSFTYQETRSTIDATGLNSLFANIEDSTDNNKIDESNTRSEALNRNHFLEEDPPNVTGYHFEIGPETYGYNPAQTGVWTDVWNAPVTRTIGTNEVLRIQWNPLVTITERQNTNAPAVRAASAFYIQFYVRSAGIDIPVSAPFGYNSICAGDGNTGISQNKTLFYERLPLSTLYLAQVPTAITNIKAKIYFDDAANYSVQFKWLYGIWIHHKY